MARKAPASKPPKFVEDPAAQKADKLKAIEQIGAAVRRLEIQEGNEREELRTTRKSLKEMREALSNAIHGIPQGELFAQASKEMSGDE